MTGDRDLESFSRAVEALEPYLGDLVFVGGWAHYLYTLRPEASPLAFEPLRTEDADIAAPPKLPKGKRSIAECLTRAEFHERLSSEHTPPISEYVLGDEETGFYLEFLAPLIGGEVKRGGRRDVTTMVGGVTAQTLRYLDILLTAPWQATLTRSQGFSVARSRTSPYRTRRHTSFRRCSSCPNGARNKQAKDLLYVHDTFAIFADALPSLKSAWESLRNTLHAAHVRAFEKRVLSDINQVTDLVRRSANVASERPAPPSPEILLARLRRGFAAAFDLAR